MESRKQLFGWIVLFLINRLLLFGSNAFAQTSPPTSDGSSGQRGAAFELVVSPDLASVLDTVYELRKGRGLRGDLIHDDFLHEMLQGVSLLMADTPPGQLQDELLRFMEKERPGLQALLPKQEARPEGQSDHRIAFDQNQREKLFAFLQRLESKVQKVTRNDRWMILNTIVPQHSVITRISIDADGSNASIRWRNPHTDLEVDMLLVKSTDAWRLLGVNFLNKPEGQ